ncbi:chromosome partitioning protein, DNA-binding protein [Liquorilactobacillus vini DSM 20605]|uniref:Chromosome partitioning protein, DNA-binding protein n=1 Tax=Liquorilactobacillus vini DSM 20605 TaxID=1133569 RepID=A0A0R2CBD9_9LACO|nr:chromosome partitioning protein, DNA-binding protein [Liquorilactobacillus vini DSM 20605]
MKVAFSFWKNKQGNSAVTDDQIQQIALEKIKPNRFQPRKTFDQQKITELAETLKEHGMLQPIILRQTVENKYEIIAGERRFRAALELGWQQVPAIIKKMSDKEAASFAVIENLQREELTAIEEAQAYRRLMELNQLTQGQLAENLGKSQSFIANKLRLLKLTPVVQQAILKRQVTERHGRSVVGLAPQLQEKIIHQVIAKQLTVKETEKLVNDALNARSIKQKPTFAKKSKGKTQDMRVAINTIKKSLKMISDSGIVLTTKEEEGPNYHRIIIDLPLENKKQN